MLERLPWFQMRPADYLLDTLGLTVDEHGLYCLMMFTYYWQGSLPSDRTELYRVAHATTEALRASVEVIAKRYFHEDGAHLVHNRIERELANVRQFMNRQSAAGKASAAARANKPPKKQRAQEAANSAPAPEQQQKHEPPTPRQGNGTAAPKKPPRPEFDPVELEALIGRDVPEQIAKDWLTTRKHKRAGALTNSVLKHTMDEAEKANINFVEAVTICAKRSWAGFLARYLLDETNRSSGRGAPGMSRQEQLEAKNKANAKQALENFERMDREKS